MTPRQNTEFALYRSLLQFFQANHSQFQKVPRFLEFFYALQENVQELDRLNAAYLTLPHGESSVQTDAEELTYDYAFSIYRLVREFATRMADPAAVDTPGLQDTQHRCYRGLESFLLLVFLLQEILPLMAFLTHTEDVQAAERGVHEAICEITASGLEDGSRWSEQKRIRSRIRSVLRESRTLFHDEVLQDPSVFNRLIAELRLDVTTGMN